MTNQDRFNHIEKAIDLGFLNPNDWEIVFLDSIYIQLSQSKEISWKQQKKLIEIWKKIK